MATSIRVSAQLPLQAQLEDGATDQYPRVTLMQPDNTVIGTYDLGHLASGLYVNNSMAMPDYEHVKAQYVVYSDSNHTTRNTAYPIAEEIFERDASATATAVSAIPTNPLLTNDARMDNLDATISSRASQESVDRMRTSPAGSTTAGLEWVGMAGGAMDQIKAAFGEVIVYTPTGRTARELVAVCDDVYQTVDPETGATIMATQPNCTIKTADCDFIPSRGDAVTMRTVNYLVIEVQPDGLASVRCLLQKP